MHPGCLGGGAAREQAAGMIEELFRRLPRRTDRSARAGGTGGDRPTDLEMSVDGVDPLAIRSLGHEWERHPKRGRRIDRQIVEALKLSDISEGRVLEIGARTNPRLHLFGSDPWSYTVMDLESHTAGIETVIGDITWCPHLSDGSFDVIISVDVFEHIDRPWLAAAEITRLLRPGGLSYTSTLFAWRYHPVPIDYWRFTPPCLEFLFGGLETISSGFDATERRRDIRGRGALDQVPVDALGGFRENWRVFHIGRRPF